MELPLPLQHCNALSVLRVGSSVLELNVNLHQGLWPRQRPAGVRDVIQSTRAYVTRAHVPWRRSRNSAVFLGFGLSPPTSFSHSLGDLWPEGWFLYFSLSLCLRTGLGLK